MPYDPNKHHRRSIRLSGYDYRQAGYYFVTVCTHGHQPLLGRVIDDGVALSVYGRIVDTIWRRLLDRSDRADLDAWVMMPNHVHAVIVLTGEAVAAGRGGVPRVPEPPRLMPGSLGAVVGSVKSVAARRINMVRRTPGSPVWQRNYYERIVRDATTLARIRTYIAQNPSRWAEDRYYGDS
jgi:REP element-mobilizing transposase RayT